ncbi:hypothetical protein FRC08_018454 [Ceratobasidium sp. 394]|nr:hypothetical protein FRC08_018454 [Ceratobasidium sp. 394]
MGDLLQIVNEYGISPTKLRNYVELIVRARWIACGEREAESNVSSTQGGYQLFLGSKPMNRVIRIESTVGRPLSAGYPQSWYLEHWYAHFGRTISFRFSGWSRREYLGYDASGSTGPAALPSWTLSFFMSHSGTWPRHTQPRSSAPQPDTSPCRARRHLKFRLMDEGEARQAHE